MPRLFFNISQLKSAGKEVATICCEAQGGSRKMGEHVIVCALIYSLNYHELEMKRLIKWLFILFFLLGMVLGMLAVNSLDDYAMVKQRPGLNTQQLARVKQFINDNNPDRMKSGQSANTRVNQLDVNLSSNYLLQKAPSVLANRLRTNVRFFKDQADIQLTMQLPQNPPGSNIDSRYINMSASLMTSTEQEKQTYRLTELSIGGNRIPDFLAQPLAKLLHQQLAHRVPEYALITQSVQRVELSKETLQLSYVWNRQAAEQLKSHLSSRIISAELKQALLAHAGYLADMSKQLTGKTQLDDVLRPMFGFAQQRSYQHDPVIENRAVFIALGAYVLNRDLLKLLGEKPTQHIKVRRMYLKGRHDLSKHLIISAAITSMADSQMAAAIGLEKEVRDSGGGSGFSFADLAADHAGIQLAEQAMASTSEARKIQRNLATMPVASMYMPDIDQLPEGLQQADFALVYQNTESAAYKNMSGVISQRISQLPLYNREYD